MEKTIKLCPYCNSDNIKKGKLLKHAQLINPDKQNSALLSNVFCSPLILDVCCNCGKVISITVENLDMFN